jgi:hypothetical protein
MRSAGPLTARPRLTGEDRLIRQGRYLHARYELTVLHNRLPTIAEIADHMEVSARTVESIRAEMQDWRREAAAVLGWDDWSGEPLHAHDGKLSPRAQILGKYAMGEITTAEASRRLALAGLPSDDRELRRWRERVRQPE